MSALAAAKAGEEIPRTRHFHFSPMNSRERRILHLALRGEADGAQRERRRRPHPASGGGSFRFEGFAGAGSSATGMRGRRMTGECAAEGPPRWTSRTPGRGLHAVDAIAAHAARVCVKTPALTAPDGRGSKRTK